MIQRIQDNSFISPAYSFEHDVSLGKLNWTDIKGETFCNLVYIGSSSFSLKNKSLEIAPILIEMWSVGCPNNQIKRISVGRASLLLKSVFGTPSTSQIDIYQTQTLWSSDKVAWFWFKLYPNVVKIDVHYLVLFSCGLLLRYCYLCFI